jgi:hypothetical protein
MNGLIKTFNIMKKLYYKVSETGFCLNPCLYDGKPTKGVMIGSGSCTSCKNCFGHDDDNHWVKCKLYHNEHNKSILLKTKEMFSKLTDEQRMEVMGDYCKYCGRHDNTCQCWNDK